MSQDRLKDGVRLLQRRFKACIIAAQARTDAEYRGSPSAAGCDTADVSEGSEVDALKATAAKVTSIALAEQARATAVSRLFPPETGTASEDSKVPIAAVLADHFWSTGRFELADAICREAELAMPWSRKVLLANQGIGMADRIRMGRYGSAMAWASKHSAHLCSIGCSLELDLHALRVASILLGRPLCAPGWEPASLRPPSMDEEQPGGEGAARGRGAPSPAAAPSSSAAPASPVSAPPELPRADTDTVAPEPLPPHFLSARQPAASAAAAATRSSADILGALAARRRTYGEAALLKKRVAWEQEEAAVAAAVGGGEAALTVGQRQRLALQYARAVFPSLLRAAGSLDTWVSPPPGSARGASDGAGRGGVSRAATAKPFSEFHVRCAAAVRRVAASIAWVAAPGGLQASPYADLVDPLRVEEAAQRHLAAFRRTERLDPATTLFRTLECADAVIPDLNKLASILERGSGAGSGGSAGGAPPGARAFVAEADELPVPAELPDHLQTHSVVVCPVSRQQCTPADPPMLLSCSHCLSRSSMQRLRAPGSGRFACPVCNTTVAADSALQLKVQF